ncbi:MAG: acetyl-CoA carboxylase biotin carboxyl carrier protein subunit [Alphaproteobacteria bacterium]|nr:acetyl-CoA carboxylase biotin carboxyl carrier protein subunit [Alphaproteobacteria bacterium]MBT4019482.1 acetyl-CoA carboxylase biotin carboxyl carrier protein subunit [Alphaproteobacteria bacterium]MBT4967304.1 acetyl-CoA carboxylase biotin carboxyl carrier protein subunit [Alphaproteobacteria bacterium]MBT5159750.1 acetyl-CoA carboxylase biotin carboxyl carrier protein subunit [Alphaproteobacteria bacterium]MBT5919270.1 acetyl-CoA carboxylase biotin carboxyl carrier protein subunit [Alph
MARKEIKSEVAGTVWLVETEVGAKVAEDDTLIVLESMKMEIPVDAPQAGIVVEILVAKDDPIEEGQAVAIIETI